MNLTPHFSLAELTASQIADRAGIDNTPEEGHVANLILLCERVLEPLRDELGPIFISSGYRCLAVNRRLSSKDTSYHVQCRAAINTAGDQGGAFGNGTAYWDDLRITKGVGRYSSNFTAPTAAFPNS